MKKLLLSIALITSVNALWCTNSVVFNDNTPAKPTAQTLAAGTLHKGFDTNGDGLHSEDLTTAVIVKDMVRGQDGALYVCGSQVVSAKAVMMVAKFVKNQYGRYALDTSFGTSGTKTYEGLFDSATLSVANAITLGTYTDANGILQEDDHFYLTGSGDVSTVSMVVVKAHKGTGSVDTNFGTSGVKLSNFGTSAVGHGIAVDLDSVYAVGTSGTNFVIMKLAKSNGTPDTAFDNDGITSGTDGQITHNVTSGTDIAYHVKLTGDALIIVGDGASTFTITKMNATTGALISDFGVSGVVTGNTAGVAKAVHIYDGYVYVAGRNTASSAGMVLKFDIATGGLDTNFGTNGVFSTSVIDTFEDIKVLAGQIYVTGNNASKGAIARLTTNGAFDTGFVSVGYVVDIASNITSGAVALAFLNEPGHPFVIAGYDTTGAGTTIEKAVVTNNVDSVLAEKSDSGSSLTGALLSCGGAPSI